jgi:hypothetical protein
MKTDLTSEEKLRAAYAHMIGGVDQHVIAALFGVNPGRINEAIMAVREAIGVEKKTKVVPTPKLSWDISPPSLRGKGRPKGVKNKPKVSP